MFNCLIHLWEWLDPPVVTSSTTSMEKLKMGGAAGAQGPGLGVAGAPPHHGAPLPASPLSPSSSATSHRRPLLDQRQQELYGATRPHPPHPSQHFHASQPRSPQHPEHQPVPPGYNVDVHNAYLRRTAERHQIYQNHCNVIYRQPEPESSYRSHHASNTELLRQQYNEIQQMKLQQQLHYQNQAQMQQQQVFAQRQLLLQQLHGLKVPSNVQTPLHHMDFSQQIQSLELDKRKFEPEYNRPKKVGAVAPLSPAPKSPEVSSPSLKSPSSSEGRRSSGSNSTILKSPIAQRLPSAPVTMSGWLYKQGSDGLKVWRKRWFVLTEYCLFYYKNHEEDKLLGSILLPSYTVSVCSQDERVGKKYAFKCEHANMRTYVLAAMDQESMNKWMKTLTMASLMQEGSVSDRQHGSLQSPGAQGEETNERSGGRQPTYANAPPKPRRSNEGYGSPSPERYDPNYDLLRRPSNNGESLQNNIVSPISAEMDNLYESKYRTKIPSNLPNRQHVNEPMYNAQNLSLLLTNTASDRLETMPVNNRQSHGYRDNHGKSPMNFDGRHSKLTGRLSSEPRDINTDEQNNEEITRRISEARNTPIGNYLQNQDVQLLANERRTPDAYGRSPVIPGYYNNRGRAGDYEDIYNLNYKNGNNVMDLPYERPTSPNVYGSRRTLSQSTSQRYTPNNMENQQDVTREPNVSRRKKSPSLSSGQPSMVPRPHSADFLEYEAANPQQNNVQTRKHGASRQPQPPRPKSSLDINSRYDHASDNFYYSEASYAEKMRQSALYLQNKGNPLLNSKNQSVKSPADYGNQFTNYSYDNEIRSRADGRSSTERSLSEAKYPDSGTNSWTQDKIGSQVEGINRSNSAMSEGIASMANGFDRDITGMEANENFMRSASARLPSSIYDQMESCDGEKKVQQREESMKRLLEWKQRMLQSPLTRKSTPSTLMLTRNLNQTKLATYQQNCSEQPHKYGGQTFPKATGKFASHVNNTYNSFSSDDEASMSTSAKGTEAINRSSVSVTNKKPFMGSNPSLGRATRETIPVRAVSPRIRWTNQEQNPDLWNHQGSQTHLTEENWSGSRTSLKQAQQLVRVVSPRVRRMPDNDDISIISPSSNSQIGDIEQLLSVQSITAGELLGRTHEELVLLLIQLRRRHVATANSIEQTAIFIHNIQDNLGVNGVQDRQENLQRLEQLKHQLVDLEKQYKKSKPLVHLVDNMVKLGSLYNRPGSSLPSTIDRLEYNHQLREKLLLRQQEDQRRWAESLSSLSASEIQGRVDELWSLHRQAAGEAATLRSLQRDHLLNGARNDPLQHVDDPISPAVEDGGALEADLSRVHMMLAQNSKKLEQTVADNARLERELMALRQKLHKHRISESSQSNSSNNNYAANNNATALLEDEVVRVQALVSQLQTQRQLLAAALRSPPTAYGQHALSYNTSPPNHNYRPNDVTETLTRMSIVTTNLAPTSHQASVVTPRKPLQQMPIVGVSPTCRNFNLEDVSDKSSTSLAPFTGSHNLSTYDNGNVKKRNHASWTETDLDSGTVTEQTDYALFMNNTLNTPLYVETTPEDNGHQNPFGNLTNVEKQEIKTVRIVKRESERRQRERSLQPEWGLCGTSQVLDHLNDDDYGLTSTSGLYGGNRGSALIRNYHFHQQIDSTKQLETAISPMEGKKFPSSPSLSVNSLSDYGVSGKSASISNGGVSPIFKSEAAREILMEMGVDEATTRRRAVPKQKRRHYTAPHHLSSNTLSELNQGDSAFYQEKVGRSLDDADLERALRGDHPRDVVRASAAPATHFSTSTIDQLLAAPTKILIPERYVPEQAPELSPEEEKKRREKVEAIRKMLSNTSTTESGKSPIEEDKKQREHLLQLNQILAKQVMEMSKIVASSGSEVSQANTSSHTNP